MAKLDRLTRSVKDLGELLERFEKRGVAPVSVAEALDTGSAAELNCRGYRTRRGSHWRHEYVKRVAEAV